MTTPERDLSFATRPLDPELIATLRRARPGQRVRVTQTVRVGQKIWTTSVTGTFRSVSALATGLATDRVPEDDVIVPTVHFTKENGELSSVALDQNSRVEILEEPGAGSQKSE